MSRLLSAGFARLKKNKTFRGNIILMAVLGFLIPVISYVEAQEYGRSVALEEGIFQYVIYMGILQAVFCSIFVGTEYQDGTIRNKVVVGRKRPEIYLSHLVVCTVAGFLTCVTYCIAYLLVGIPLFGGFQEPAAMVLLLFICSAALCISYTAIYVVVAMLCQSRTITAQISLLLAFGMLLAGSYISSRLSEPEYWTDYVIMEGESTIREEEIHNPNFLQGTERKVYEFLQEFLPGGQMVLLSSKRVENMERLLLYDMLILAGGTGAGIFFFRRKDLK